MTRNVRHGVGGGVEAARLHQHHLRSFTVRVSVPGDNGVGLCVSELLMDAFGADRGLALLPWVAVHEDVSEGRLVPVLLDSVGVDHPINLVYCDREYVDPKVRVFIDRAVPILKARFGRTPPPP